MTVSSGGPSTPPRGVATVILPPPTPLPLLPFATKVATATLPSPPASAVLVPEAEEADEMGNDMAVSDSGKRGRRPKFSKADDLLIVREVAAAKEHVLDLGRRGSCSHKRPLGRTGVGNLM